VKLKKIRMKMAVCCTALLLSSSVTVAASFTEDFSSKTIDDSKWLVDDDSGYESGIVNGVYSIKGGPEGSGGPCDGIAAYSYGTTFSFDINPVKLTPGSELKDHQMGAVYFAQTEQRGGPVIAYGFIADPNAKGKVSLAWLHGDNPVWNVVKSGLDSNKWYTLGGKVLKDTVQIDLYFQGKVIETCDITFQDESPKLVLRSGSWDGTNEDSLEMLLPNPVLRHDGPSTAQLMVNAQDELNRWVVHILHYIPQNRAERLAVIEDVIPLYNIRISIKVPREVVRVECVPSCENISFERREDRIEFVVPEVVGHQMIILSFE
jgi:hypothetical protein